jgi:hypothetical protein
MKVIAYNLIFIYQFLTELCLSFLSYLSCFFLSGKFCTSKSVSLGYLLRSLFQKIFPYGREAVNQPDKFTHSLYAVQ